MSLSEVQITTSMSSHALNANAVAEGVVGIDPKIEYVVKELRSVMNGNITPLTIMMAISQGVLIMRKFGSLTGKQKKGVLNPALYLLVAQSSMSENDKMASNMLLDMGLNDIVDNLVFMASGMVQMSLTKLGCCVSVPPTDPA